MKTGVVPKDGMVITEDTRFAPGVYGLTTGVVIGADGVTVEGDGTLIASAGHKGVAIHADGRARVTIRNLAMSGFYHGIRLDHCADATIENVKVRDTWEIEGIDTFLYLWRPIEEVYGGAILCHNTRRSAIRNCDLQHQLNGVLLYACAGITVEKCNASFNSGWGVYLTSSNDCVIADNRLDFCDRVYRRPEDGSIRVEADSAAIVMVKGSSRNRVLRNSCLCGGDGIFVVGYDYKGTVEPCNDNVFEDNDCRLSPNNGVEFSFCGGGVFRRNNCSRSNYGFWMGYIWDTVVEDNDVEFSRWAGIASHDGHNVTLRNNRVRLNGDGIRLWTHGKPHPHYPQMVTTYNYIVEGNLIESNRNGFNGFSPENSETPQCHDIHLRENSIRDNRIGVQLQRAHDCEVEHNQITNNVVAGIMLLDEADVTIGNNEYAANAADVEQVAQR